MAENKVELQHHYKEKQIWIADSLPELYEQFDKSRFDAQRICREQQNWAADSLAEACEQVSKKDHLPNQATFVEETKGKGKVLNYLNDNVVKVKRLVARSILFSSAGLILLFIGFFFVLNKSAPPTKIAAPASTNLEISKENSKIIDSPQVASYQGSIKSTPISEWGQVMNILELIRSAQLKKDINLFLNAYSPSFPNVDQKKENILKTWRQYHYIEMHYHIKNIHKIDKHTIVATVTWEIIYRDVHSKKKSNLVKDYTIQFSDVSGKLLIQQLI